MQVKFYIKSNIRLEQSDEKSILIDDIHGEFYECNHTALFVIKKLFKGATREELVSSLLNNYEIDNHDANAEIEQCLNCLAHMGILDEEKSHNSCN